MPALLKTTQVLAAGLTSFCWAVAFLILCGAGLMLVSDSWLVALAFLLLWAGFVPLAVWAAAGLALALARRSDGRA